MGIYTEYLDLQPSFQELAALRKEQLRRISELRGGRDVLVFAADLKKAAPETSVNYADILPINDQLSNLSGDSLDVILETPGGSGETAEDIVKLLHGKYQEVAVIVPGWAKSAGTIVAMAGDEILMEPASALGPIDAQLFWQGKVYSADNLLEQMDKIKQEVIDTGQLNKAYIPILNMMSLGELQAAENALQFAKSLVKEWLAKYKFKNWTTHSSSGELVTEAEKHERAGEIANQLCNHRYWLTHARSIKIADLEAMRLKITDYSQQPALAEAIRRYHALLHMTFETNAYKVFETPVSQIYRFFSANVPSPTPAGNANPKSIVFELTCNNCGHVSRIQANLEADAPLAPGMHPFPTNSLFTCPGCKVQHDLSDARRQIEGQTGKQVLTTD